MRQNVPARRLESSTATVGGEGLAVDVDKTVELTVTTLGSVLGVVTETGTGVVERVDEEKRSGTSSLSYVSLCQ